MINSAKIYNDSYSEDLFGEAPYGCQIVKLSELINKKIAKDITLKNKTCNVESNNSFIVIRKYNNEYSYNGYLYCADDKGVELYSDMDKSYGVCSNENSGPEVLVDVESNEANNSKMKSVKVTLLDEYGFVADQSFEYVWLNQGEENNITNDTFKNSTKYEFHNKSIKTTGDKVKLVSKSISMPNGGNEEKSLMLAIRPIRVQNIVNLSNTEIKVVGPFRYDKKSPDCPTVTVKDQNNNTINSSGGSAKELTFNLSFNNNDYKEYDIIEKVDGTEELNLTNQTATSIKATKDGRYELDLIVRDYAGNEKSCNISNFIKDNGQPTCGTAEGSSNSWTNSDRTIKQNCSDSLSGCAKPSYDTTYTTTTWTGSVTISDNAGNTKKCDYNVYVDKNPPTIQVRNMRGIAGDTEITSSNCTGSNWVSGSCTTYFKAFDWNYESNFRCVDNESGCSNKWEIIWDHNGHSNAKCGKVSPRKYVTSCGWSCGRTTCTWTTEYHMMKDKAGNAGEVVLYNHVYYTWW